MCCGHRYCAERTKSCQTLVTCCQERHIIWTLSITIQLLIDLLRVLCPAPGPTDQPGLQYGYGDRETGMGSVTLKEKCDFYFFFPVIVVAKSTAGSLPSRSLWRHGFPFIRLVGNNWGSLQLIVILAIPGAFILCRGCLEATEA